MAISENDDLQYEEDEYGYVRQPQAVRASQALISQLPSRHIDNLIDEEPEEQQDAATTSRNSTLRQRKSSHYKTLKLKNATLNSRSTAIDADKIYRILSSDPDADYEEKVKTLREMTISLSIKRQVLWKLNEEKEEKITSSKYLGSCVRCKLGIGMAARKFWFELKSWCYRWEPWHSSIKTIQGQFGSCVSSYFIFLRWLLYLNMINFFITLCFVIIPHIINKGVGNHGNGTTGFQAEDLFTGSGWLQDTLLYFGSYSGEVIEPISGLPYNMPLAYLCAACVNMLIILLILSISITSSYQKNYVDTAGEIKNVFCNKIFSAWDYSIQTEEAAELQRRTICNDIKELLFMKRLSERTITRSQNILQKVSCFAVSLFTLGAVVLVGYITYSLLKSESHKAETVQQLRFPIALTLISSFAYYLLKYAGKLEVYITPKSRLYLTMIRCLILRTIMLGVVVYFWMIVYKPPRDQKVCYENELGSELYRLILMNFLSAVIIFTLIGEFLRKLVTVCVATSINVKEFDVAYNTLDLIYFQTLAWLATFYVPLISLIVVIVLVLIFYIKKGSLSLRCCRPPDKSWSVNEMQTFYLLLTFVMFLFSVVTVGYTIFGLETSDCGPFKKFPTAGEAVHNVFLEGKVGRVVAEILKYGTSPVVLVVIFCALCLAVHYMRAQANAHISVIKKIRETLILASKDKAFLLKLYDEAVESKRRDGGMELNGSAMHGDVVVNETYSDYSDHSVESPIRRKYHPNYIPADVPVNKLPHTSPLQKSPHAGHKGSPYPPHQPGFRQILSPGKIHTRKES